MSSVEERLARDIAAVTGGVVVTDSDLRDARDEIEQRIDDRRQQGRRRVLVAAAAAAVLLPLAGFAVLQAIGEYESAPPASTVPSPDPFEGFLTGDAPTPEAIDGIWRVDNGVTLVQFEENGAVRLDSGGTLLSDPDQTGTYEMDGDVITVSIAGGPDGCSGKEFALRASLPVDGEMRVVHTRPGAAACRPAAQDERWVLEHVLPTDNEGLSGLRAPDSGAWRTPADPADLHGDWMADTDDIMVQMNDGGFVLELGPDETYLVATVGDIVRQPPGGNLDVVVVDQGRWRLTDAGLTLVSDETSLLCEPRSRSEGAKLGLLDGGGLYAMRMDFTGRGCASPWMPSTWFLLPHQGS